MTHTILVIDDEESIRYSFKSFLSKEGYQVFEADSYPSALDILARDKVDVIFSDIVLNEYNGVELLRKIKEKNINCPIIMVTGQPDMNTATESLRLGAFDYLIKPIEKDDILKIARLALNYKILEDEKKIIADENLKYQKNLEAIFRSVSEAIITFDKNGIILNANKAVYKIFNIDPKRMIKKDIRSIPQFSDILSGGLLEFDKDSGANEHYIHFSKGRNDQILVLNTSPLKDSESAVIGKVLAFRDETKLSSLEKQLNERYKFHNIIGKSHPMQRIYNLIENLAKVDTTVLITGESGTGKELIAGALHYQGTRANHPFVCLNCSALSENLLESELFGHVKGAFTGAVKNKTGRFHEAHKGSLFLDEIGDISPMIQLKLLRVLQEKKFERVGDSTSFDTNVRIIAATNKNLKDLIREGQFREDLFYRLKVVEIHLPPLRERLEDIPLLVEHFVKRFNTKFRKKIKTISNDVLHMFMAYPWPGNIRELEHAMEHAFVLCDQGLVTPKEIPVEIMQRAEKQKVPMEATVSVSDHQIVQMLEQTRWNKAETARLLGISRQTLYRRLKKSKIEL